MGSGGILKLGVPSLPSSAKVALCKQSEGEREGGGGGGEGGDAMAAIVEMEAG